MDTDAKKYELLVREILAARLKDDTRAIDFKVFHGKKYLGKSGHNHQIDVSAELKLAGIKILILVECKLYSKKVGIDDILEFATRMDDIGAHKGIIVTTVGFQKGTAKIAKSKGIALVVACDLGWSPRFESPIAEIRRHEMFVNRARDFLCWLLDISNPADCPQEAVAHLSRLDVTSALGVTPQPFLSLKEGGMGLQYASMFAPRHGFVFVGKGVDLVLDRDGFFSLLALELSFSL